MDIRKLQRAIVDGLEDVKAQNIAVFNTEHLSPLFERVIVASGTSNRQTKALASSVRDAVKSRGMQVLRTEGEENGEWIIVDCGAAVCHVMQPAIREYYRLEEIWGGKAVKLKMGAGGPVSRSRAPSGDDEDDTPTPAKPARRGRSAVEEALAPEAPARRSDTPKKAAAKKAVARKVVAKKASARAPVGTRTVERSAPVPRKTAARKTAAAPSGDRRRRTTEPAADATRTVVVPATATRKPKVSPKVAAAPARKAPGQGPGTASTARPDRAAPPAKAARKTASRTPRPATGRKPST